MASAKTPATHSPPCTDTFSECVERHRAAEDNPYVAAARARIGCDDEHEINEITVVSESDDGAWVAAVAASPAAGAVEAVAAAPTSVG